MLRLRKSIFVLRHSNKILSQLQKRQTFVSLSKACFASPDDQKNAVAQWEKRMGTVNYFPDFIHAWNPSLFKQVGGAMALATGGSFLLFGLISPLPYVACAVTGLYWKVGLNDMNQKRHTVRRNFPVLGHMRYIMESLRPEIHQYFVEPDQGGRPFNRDQRAQVYQRAKNIDAVMPFGTRLDVYEEGYEVSYIFG
jgi:hypothetical protein